MALGHRAPGTIWERWGCDLYVRLFPKVSHGFKKLSLECSDEDLQRVLGATIEVGFERLRSGLLQQAVLCRLGIHGVAGTQETSMESSLEDTVNFGREEGEEGTCSRAPRCRVWVLLHMAACRRRAGCGCCCTGLHAGGAQGVGSAAKCCMR